MFCMWVFLRDPSRSLLLGFGGTGDMAGPLKVGGPVVAEPAEHPIESVYTASRTLTEAREEMAVHSGPRSNRKLAARNMGAVGIAEVGQGFVLHASTYIHLHRSVNRNLHRSECDELPFWSGCAGLSFMYFYMMHATSELFALVEKRRTELGLSQVDIGRRAFGKADNSAVQNLKKGSSPSVENMAAICAALGMELYIGPKRSPEPPVILEIDGSAYARIPVHDAKLSAGPGEMNEGVAIIDHMAFRHDWLRKIDVKPENALMARIAGDSMAPAIQSGDLVMIDKTRRDVPAFKKTRLPQQLPIFAFRQDDQARVKRLERRVKEKMLVLYSDNPLMPPELIGEGDVHTLAILGQVVWSGHVWR